MELLMRGLAMDHSEVVRQKLTERYLLNELEGEQRDQFEEHFFDCPECALDIRAGSEFVESSKVILAEPAEQAAPAGRASREPVRSGRLPWTSPRWSSPPAARLRARRGSGGSTARAGRGTAPAGQPAPHQSVPAPPARSDRPARPGGTDQRLPMKTAIDDYTSGSAFAAFDEKDKGTLKPGMLADIAVLATDVFTHPPTARGDVAVTVTILDGKPVFKQ